MTVHSREIPGGATLANRWPPILPRNQDRTEVRILAAIVTGGFGYFMAEPVMYAWSVDTSLLLKVTFLAGHPTLVLLLMALCVALLVPHFVSLLVLPRFLDCRAPRLMAFAGALGACVIWFYLADLARPLDVGPLPYLYLGRSFANLVMAAVFAFSLNSQQLREMLHVSQAAA